MTTRTRVYCGCGYPLTPGLDHCGRAVCATRELEHQRQRAALDPLAQCIIVGCLDPRVGANLCRAHDRETSHAWQE